MGLNVSIYKDQDNLDYDCTLNGISSKPKSLTIINIDGPFKASAESPAALLVPGNIKNSAKIIPVGVDQRKIWLMFGGNFAFTSDSRFCRAVEKLQNGIASPVAIHDRVES